MVTRHAYKRHETNNKPTSLKLRKKYCNIGKNILLCSSWNRAMMYRKCNNWLSADSIRYIIDSTAIIIVPVLIRRGGARACYSQQNESNLMKAIMLNKGKQRKSMAMNKRITVREIMMTDQGAVSIRKTVLPGMAIPMLKIRRPNGRLIFNMEIAIRR